MDKKLCQIVVSLVLDGRTKRTALLVIKCCNRIEKIRICLYSVGPEKRIYMNLYLYIFLSIYILC